MTSEPPPPAPRPRFTLFGVLSFLGNFLILSLCVLVLCLGLVTSAPGCAAALAARERLAADGAPVSVRGLFAETGALFSRLWMFGPLVALAATMTWIALAFWLVAPAPLNVIMLAVTVMIAVVAGLVGFAVPTAGRASGRAREVLPEAARTVALRPWPSILALAAAVAAVVLSIQLPPVGLVLIGGALTEIAHRAWRRARPVR